MGAKDKGTRDSTWWLCDVGLSGLPDSFERGPFDTLEEVREFMLTHDGRMTCKVITRRHGHPRPVRIEVVVDEEAT